MSDRSIKLSLHQNSHAFLNEAVRKALAATEDIHQWQFAILNLVQSAELSLKAALHQVHPTLVLGDIDNRKSPVTVTLMQAMLRLQDARVAGYTFSGEDKQRLESALKVRNEVTHSNFELKPEYAAAKFFELLPFVLNFQRQHLGTDITSMVDHADFSALLKIEKALRELVDAAKARIERETIDAGLVWACPDCDQDTFVVSDAIDTCYTCGNSTPVVECPQCEELCFKEELESFADDLDIGRMDGQWFIHNDYGYRVHEACPECLPKVREKIQEERAYEELADLEEHWRR